MPQVTSNLFHLIAKFRSFVSDFLFLLHDKKFLKRQKSSTFICIVIVEKRKKKKLRKNDEKIILFCLFNGLTIRMNVSMCFRNNSLFDVS
jgi:hypothetical protein